MADNPPYSVNSNCDNDSDSYVFGSHEDVLWSFEQQVRTMEKYGVVANSVEFEDLERSLDEELKKYNLYDTTEDKKDTSTTTNNTSKIVHDGSTDSDSDPNSLNCCTSSTPSEIDKLYKKFYRENSISPSDGEFRAPSDLDYYPTKQTPRVYPKSPKPSPRGRGRTSFGGSEEVRDSVLDMAQPNTVPSPGYVEPPPSRVSSRNSSPGYSKLVYSSSTLPRNLGTRDHHQLVGTRGHHQLVGVRDHHQMGNSSFITGSTPSLLGYRHAAVSPPIQSPVTKGYTTASYHSIHQPNGYKEDEAVVDSNKITRPDSRSSINRHKTPDNKEVELQDIIKILTSSSNLNLVNTAAGALQHLSCGDDEVKNQIREGGAIPVLVHLLSLDDLVCLSSLGVLRNITFGRNNHLNRIAVQDAHGITLLVQLLNTTQSYEIQELVTGVLWNLSSTDTVKDQILKQALDSIVKNIIIPLSGWEEDRPQTFELGYDKPTAVSWTTVFRNATGCLKNLSSAGPEGRTQLRLCHGLVDSLFWTIRAAQGKNDVDNKAVENAVCILRNLSYRLESEVPPDVKYGSHEDWRSRGLGGGQFRALNKHNDVKKKKKTKVREICVTPLPEHTAGVGLLWQPGVVRVYLDLLLECSNPETLEGAAGAIQNLSACSWPPAQEIREVVRREKGLSVLTSLLRLPNDSVIRATAFCLRNLAQDAKNKELLGKHAMMDLVKRLPGVHGNDGITDLTITAVLSALSELVTSSEDNAKMLRDSEGIERLVEVARSHDTFTRQCVVGAHLLLGILSHYTATKKYLKAMGWSMSNMHSLDRTDGLEFDENQLHVTSYRDNYQNITSPDPTFDSHTLDRNYRIPSVPLPRATSSSPHHHPSHNNGVAAPHYDSGSVSGTLRKSTSLHQYSSPLYDSSAGDLDHRPDRATPDLPPPRPRTSQRYHVSDSWV